MALRVQEANGRVRLSVRVQPRASQSAIVGIHGDALKIRVSAPPVDGAANAALIEFLADIVAVSRRSVRILAGESSRSKVVEIDGITERVVRELVDSTQR